jgi:hypothetical protein
MHNFIYVFIFWSVFIVSEMFFEALDELKRIECPE